MDVISEETIIGSVSVHDTIGPYTGTVGNGISLANLVLDSTSNNEHIGMVILLEELEVEPISHFS